MSYQILLTDRAAKDLDRLNRDTQQRILRRLEQLAGNPYDPRFSAALVNKGGLRKSRVGAWRIIFTVDDAQRIVSVLTIERRGQVYQRI